MTFELLLSRLKHLLKEKVRNGELTERGMARATGMSQPHIHNILKGIRVLPTELADQLIKISGYALPDLMNMSDPQPGAGQPVPEPEGAAICSFQLLEDRSMEPRFQQGDIVYYRASAVNQRVLDPDSVFLVRHNGLTVARYLRMGGYRLYLACETNLHDPAHWDYVSLSEKHILEIVRGQIVWICRKVEGSETGASQKTRWND